MSHEYAWTQTDPLDNKYVTGTDIAEVYAQMNVQRVARGLAPVSWPAFWEAYFKKEPYIQL